MNLTYKNEAKEESKSQTLANMKESIILSIDEAGNIVSINPNAKRWLKKYGLFKIGTYFIESVLEEDRVKVTDLLKLAFDHNHIQQFHLRVKEQEEFLFLTKTVPIIKNGAEQELLLMMWEQPNNDIHSLQDGKAINLRDKENLTTVMKERIQEGKPFTLVKLQMEQLSLIFDIFGKETEQEVFLRVIKRLNSYFEGKYPMYRVDQDRIAMLMPSDSKQWLSETMRDLFVYLHRPVMCDGKELKVAVRAALVRYPDQAKTLLDLYHLSETALEIGKKIKHPFYILEKDKEIQYMKNIQWERDLVKAVSDNQFDLHYQPVMDTKDGRIKGVEALLRWNHPEKGLIPPAEFIPYLEETGLIVQVGYESLRKSCQQLKKWQQAGFTDLRMHINLSVRQLITRELLDYTAKIIKEEGISADQLVFEITESIVMEDSDHFIQLIRQIRNLGIGVSIDDFGTGYSALSYLTRMNIDNIKIDKSFVQNIGQTKEDAVVKSIISLAHHLHLSVTAEGVETAEQISFLLENECDDMQGFYFSKPLDVHAITNYLEKQTS